MNINEYNENYLTAQFEELSQRDMKKYRRDEASGGPGGDEI